MPGAATGESHPDDGHDKDDDQAHAGPPQGQGDQSGETQEASSSASAQGRATSPEKPARSQAQLTDVKSCQPPGTPDVSPVMRRIAIALVVAFGAAGPAQARVHTIAPPGNSGVGQYLETVPTAGGAQPSNTVHPSVGAVGGAGKPPGGSAGATGSPGAGAISSSTQRALAGQGPTGAAAAALARATAPAPTGPAGHGATSAVSGGGASPAASVLKSLTGSSSGSGLGPLLPSLLIVSLLGAAVLALLRRRRAS